MATSAVSAVCAIHNTHRASTSAHLSPFFSQGIFWQWPFLHLLPLSQPPNLQHFCTATTDQRTLWLGAVASWRKMQHSGLGHMLAADTHVAHAAAVEALVLAIVVRCTDRARVKASLATRAAFLHAAGALLARV